MRKYRSISLFTFLYLLFSTFSWGLNAESTIAESFASHKLVQLKNFTTYPAISFRHQDREVLLPAINQVLLEPFILVENKKYVSGYSVKKRYSETKLFAFESSTISTNNISQEVIELLSQVNLGLTLSEDIEFKFYCTVNSYNHEIRNYLFIQFVQWLKTREKFDKVANEVEQTCLVDKNNWDNQDVVLATLYARALMEKADFDKALITLKKILVWFEQSSKVHDRGLAYFDVLADFGLVSSLQGYFTKSDIQLKQGYDAIKKADQYFRLNGYEFSTIKSLSHLWSYYTTQEEFVKAIQSIDLSLKIIETVAPESIGQKATNLVHKALVLKRIGDISGAIQVTRKAINTLSVENFQYKLASLYINLAGMYRQIGDIELAEKYYNYANLLLENNKSEFDKGIIFMGLAYVEKSKNNSNKAVEYLTRSRLFLEMSPKHLAAIDISLAIHSIQKDDIDGAENYLSKADEYFQPSVISLESLDYYLALTRLYLKKNEYVKAENYLDAIKKHISSVELYSKNTMSLNNILIVQLVSYMELRIELMKKNLLIINDIEYIDEMIRLVRVISTNLDTNRAGPQWSNYTNFLINSYVEILYNKYLTNNDTKWLEKIYQLLENNSVFSTRLRRKNVTANSDLIINGGSLQVAKTDNLDTAQRQIIESDIPTSKLVSEINLDKLSNGDDWFKGKSNLLSNAILDINQVQAKVHKHEAIIRYFFVGERLLGFIITKSDWYIHDFHLKKTEIKRLLSEFRPSQLSIPNNILNELGKLFPVSITKNEEIHEVIIATTEILNLVPFNALNISNQTNYFKPVIARFSIIRPLHLSLYFKSDVEHKYDHQTITVFADPIFETSKELTNTDKIEFDDDKRSWFKTIRRLPETAKEAEVIGEIMKEWRIYKLLGEDATRQELLSEQSRNSAILHIASHGYFSKDNPDIVGIATSVVDSKNKKQNGFLSLRSILSLPFNSQLILVSGCETGLGKELKGEGLLSISNGLIGQGAGGVVSSLWKIPDKSTALFMSYFYGELRSNGGKVAKALQVAQMTMFRSGRFKNPLYWASFSYSAATRLDTKIPVFSSVEQ